MLVCHCRGISDRQIRRAVESGCASTREVARETGASMRCGGCRSTVDAVVNEALAEEGSRSSGVLAAASESMREIALPVIEG